jgi:hypothetical protein
MTAPCGPTASLPVWRRSDVDGRRDALRYWFLVQLTLSAAAWGTIALLLTLAA